MIAPTYSYKRYSSSKHIRILIRPGGKIIVTAPKHIPLFLLRQIVKSKAPWIENQLNAMPQKPSNDYKLHKDRAFDLVTMRLAFFNTHYGFQYKRVSIRNQSTRWGSCSNKGTLCFNYKIVNLPSELVDYLVVHELCHLKEHNHSPRFWALVGQTIPDYKDRKKQLKAWPDNHLTAAIPGLSK